MKLIIADDSAFVRNIIAKTIGTHFPNAAIIQCTNGQEALDAVQSSEADWLITDLLMPGMTGQELLSKIKESDIKIKTIVISADVQKGTRDEIEAYAIDAFIAKPLTPDKLNVLVERIKGE